MVYIMRLNTAQTAHNQSIIRDAADDDGDGDDNADDDDELIYVRSLGEKCVYKYTVKPVSSGRTCVSVGNGPDKYWYV